MPIAIDQIYENLYSEYGPQSWWPGETPFEVMVGAILTQNTAWSNVEKAIANLKKAGLIQHPATFHATGRNKISVLIKPAGYFNIKSGRLINYLDFYSGFDYDHKKLSRTTGLREKLLSVNGIGKETADSIMLYALNKATFVVDAYTKRLLYRLGALDDESTDYDAVADIFNDCLKCDTKLYNEYHALIVVHGKERCSKRAPKCTGCPLEKNCRHTGGTA